jgi:integrase
MWGHLRDTGSRIWGHRLLTDLQCRNAKAKALAYKLTDGRGLYLFVTTTGFRSWRWKYRFAGKEKRLTFGSYPDVSLTAARELRDSADKLRRSGVDPSIERKQRAAETAIGAGNTFELVARQWHDQEKTRWSPHHARNVIGSLEEDVFPAIGGMPIKAVTSPLVLKVIRAIEDRGALETARRIRQRISMVFAFAIGHGQAEADPAAVIKDILKPVAKKGRRPAYRDLEDARALLRETEAAPGHPVTKLASRLLALTLVRPGVLRSAPWNGELKQLDGKEPLWWIPAERMKLGLERKQDDTYDHLVPLSRQAVEVILAVKMLTGRGPLMFPNLRNAHEPMSENAIGYMYNRILGVRGRHVPHGWRATFSTIMNERAELLERPADRAIIDLMLAHVPDNIEGAYNRAAYMPRRRQIAQEWADMLLDGFPPAESLLKRFRS